MENSVKVPQEIKTRIIYDLAIQFMGIYPKQTTSVSHRDICTSMFTIALFISQDIEPT